MSDVYQSGVCNISLTEISHRRNTYGIGGAVVAFALFAILSFLDLPPLYYIIMAAPLYTSAMGFLQAQEKFCVWYGMNGVKNMSDNIGETQEIIGAINRKRDKAKAQAIRTKAIIYVVPLTILLGILGHIL